MISICIPCYEMHGYGSKYLNILLNSIKNQTFKDFEVVISDQSNDNSVKEMCDTYRDIFDISYYRCGNKGYSSFNLNNAIKKSKYEIIKPVFQDDFFITNNALSLVAEAKYPWGGLSFTHFNEDGNATGNTMTPRYNYNIRTGVNTFGSPSVCFFENDGNYFNDKLIWLMDCEFYEKMFRKYGIPKQVNSEISVGIRVWENSYTNHISEDTKKKELQIIEGAYG